jgi:hypothetical protein
VRWLAGLILFLFLFGCAAPQVKPEEGPCVKGEIYFGIDAKAWKKLDGAPFKSRPMYIYDCIGNDEGDALNLETFFDGQGYRLYRKKYIYLETFGTLGEMKAAIEADRPMGPRR